MKPIETLKPVETVKRAYKAADFVVSLLIGACIGAPACVLALSATDALLSSLMSPSLHGVSVMEIGSRFVDKHWRPALGSWSHGIGLLLIVGLLGAVLGAAVAWRLGKARLRRLRRAGEMLR